MLQSGYGNGADIWSAATAHPPAVAPGLATTNRVCAYDRPGTILSVDATANPLPSVLPGRSDQVTMPRTAAAVVTEWHDVLAAAGVRVPTSWSVTPSAACSPCLYARTYPDQVAGMVLVDATPPAFATLLPATSQTLLSDSLEGPEPHPRIPVRGLRLRRHPRLHRRGPGPATGPHDPALRRTPTGVIGPGDPTAPRRRRLRVQDQARAQFAAGIPGVTTTLVPDASHYIQVERPDAVIEAVRAVASKAP